MDGHLTARFLSDNSSCCLHSVYIFILLKLIYVYTCKCNICLLSKYFHFINNRFILSFLNLQLMKK